MSTVKISELTALTSADAADELVIVDDSAGVTKKITAANLNASFDVSVLDDYEEGTWTPSFDLGTFSYDNQTGFYTKIGNLVTAFFIVGWSSRSGSGAVRVTLPFNVSSVAKSAGFPGYMSGVDNSGDRQITFNANEDSSYLVVRYVVDNGGAQASDISNLNSSGQIQGTMVYFTS